MTKKLSKRARKQDVPNVWYHSLKERAKTLEMKARVIKARHELLMARFAKLERAFVGTVTYTWKPESLIEKPKERKK